MDEIPYGRGSGEVLPDGTFQVKGLLRDKYTLNLFAPQRGSYLKAVRLGGRDLPDWEVDLTTAASEVHVELVVSMRAASVEGLATDEDRPVPGAWVLLVSDFARAGRKREWYTAVADQNGQFRFGSLAPGKYKVYAFDEHWPSFLRDLETLQPFESQATAVTLEEGERKVVRAAVLPSAEPLR